MKRCIFAIMAAMLLCGCSIKEEPDTLAVSFFDVGKADSFLMTCGGKNLLMDAGTAKDGKKVAKRLEDMGVESIDYLMITHFDRDHAGGIHFQRNTAALSANLLASLNLLGILNRNSSLSVLKEYYKHYHCNDDCTNNKCSNDCLWNRLVCNKLTPESSKILRNTGNNVDCQNNRNTISDTLFRDTLTNPHQHSRTCSQTCDNHDKCQRSA